MNKSVAPTAQSVGSPVLTVKETAKYLRVSESMVWKLLRQNQITALRLGDRVLFSRSYLEQFIGAGE